MAKMTVYHGGYTPIEIPEIRIGKNTKDFGSGFYYLSLIHISEPTRPY